MGEIVKFPVERRKPDNFEWCWTCEDCGSNRFLLMESGVFCADCGQHHPDITFQPLPEGD